MRTTLSDATLEAMHSVSTSEVLLPLVKLSQADWADSIRIVPNGEPITYQSDVYVPYAFEIALPDEEAGGVPVLNWAADNVNRDITAALRAVKGTVDAQVVLVLASSPDHIEIGPTSLVLHGIEYDTFQLTGALGITPILETQFGVRTMTPKDAPALF